MGVFIQSGSLISVLRVFLFRVSVKLGMDIIHGLLSPTYISIELIHLLYFMAVLINETYNEFDFAL